MYVHKGFTLNTDKIKMELGLRTFSQTTFFSDTKKDLADILFKLAYEVENASDEEISQKLNQELNQEPSQDLASALLTQLV